MAKGAWSATATDSVLVAADDNRAVVVLQHTAGDDVWLGFGEAAVVGQGIKMGAAGTYLQITDHRAMLAIHGKCDTAKTASGGYQTA